MMVDVYNTGYIDGVIDAHNRRLKLLEGCIDGLSNALTYIQIRINELQACIEARDEKQPAGKTNPWLKYKEERK